MGLTLLVLWLFVSIFTGCHFTFLFAHELFMSTYYLYAVRGKRVNHVKPRSIGKCEEMEGDTHAGRSPRVMAHAQGISKLPRTCLQCGDKHVS